MSLMNFVTNHQCCLPGTSPSSLPGLGRIEKAQALKKELLSRLERLGSSLPNNMLDELIDALGGTDNVAEVGSLMCVLVCEQ